MERGWKGGREEGGREEGRKGGGRFNMLQYKITLFNMTSPPI